jgi:purine-cytosine permease-like protein
MMTTFTNKPEFASRYDTNSAGGLLAAALSPAGGFGQFCLVVLALGVISNNIPTVYSLALTVQALHPWIQAIPRPFIVVLGTIVYVTLSIAGVNHFTAWFNTFMGVSSYWWAIYATIVIEEHLIFRRGMWHNYEPDSMGDSKALPVGIATSFGIVAGG